MRRTVRLFSIVLAAALLLVLTPVMAHAADEFVTFSFSAPASVKPGETVNIPLNVTSNCQAQAFLAYNLSYDNSKLEYLGYKAGSLLTNSMAGDVGPVNGGFVAGYVNPIQFNGEFLTLQFRVREGAAGSCTVSMSATASRNNIEIASITPPSCTLTIACAHTSKREVGGTEATCVSSGTKAYWFCDQCGTRFDANGAVLSEQDVVIPALGHDWTDATCDAPKTCKRCGVTEGNPLEHDWKEATCTAPKTCKLCGKTEGKELGHFWIEATCTRPLTCNRCGETSGEPKGHQWKKATCTAPKTCTVCSETEGDPLPHTWAEATCTDPKTCTVCGKTEGTAKGHSPQTALTSENGRHFHKCTVCGEKLDEASCSGGKATCVAKAKCEVCGAEYGALLAHSYSADWSKGDATGHWHECTVCGGHDTPVAHTPDHDEPSEDYDVLCTVCGYVITPKLQHVHVPTPVPGKPATCEEAGRMDYYSCGKCGKLFADATGNVEILSLEATVLPAKGHTWQDATCTTPKTCTVCGKTEGKPLGHTLGEKWLTKDGKHYHQCIRCDWTADEAACSGGTATCAVRAKCEECGAEYGELAPHTYGTEWARGDATGHWHVCTVCGGHDTPVAHTPDHDEPSEDYDVLCTVCGYVITPKLDHVHRMTRVDGKPATCEESGQIDYYVCRKCGKMFADATGVKELQSLEETILPALGHDWKDADCEHPKTCANCGLTEGEALGHEMAKTWTADKSAHWHACVRCDYVYADTKAAHTTTLQGKRAPTASATGYTGDTVCTVCGYVVSAGKVIPRLTSNPKTGDTTALGIPMVILVISGLGVCAAAWVYRKKVN